MLTPSQLKLYELLKTDEQCKLLIEELKEWCILNKKNIIYKIVIKTKNKCWINRIDLLNPDISFKLNNEIRDIFEIIWLPLSEHFIRLYCKNKNIDCNFNRKDLYLCSTEFVWKEFWIRLDNTKDFNSQSDECYNSIYEALINL